MVAEADKFVIREHVLDELAWVRDTERDELDAEVAAAGGDLKIDSKEGEAICIGLEDALGLGELVEASDLKPEELTSLSSLTRLFTKRLSDRADIGKDAA